MASNKKRGRLPSPSKRRVLGRNSELDIRLSLLSEVEPMSARLVLSQAVFQNERIAKLTFKPLYFRM